MTPSPIQRAVERKLPSQRIEELARKRLDGEKAKGMVLFPKGIHEEMVIESILDYLDEIIPKLLP